MLESELIARMRAELGDLGAPFQDVYMGTGEQGYYDLSQGSIAYLTSVTVTQDGSTGPLTERADYQLMDVEGRIVLLGGVNPLPKGAILVVTGFGSGMLSQSELERCARDAQASFFHKRFASARAKTASGFIEYVDAPAVLATMPDVEELPLVLLGVINALWKLATDSASDVNVDTVEGTHIDRGQRFQQLMAMIDAVTARYHDICQQLNIGLWRIEVTDLRRVSHTTSRLIPIYREREYDDYGLAVRELPPMDHPNDDPSEIPNPGFGGGWW